MLGKKSLGPNKNSFMARRRLVYCEIYNLHMNKKKFSQKYCDFFGKKLDTNLICRLPAFFMNMPKPEKNMSHSRN